uniref:Cell adhesion molecule 3-like n=1 Tax=Neolamprologus brichardi TaxID=32507 RepID=A0A3Q4GST7_NEOBR
MWVRLICFHLCVLGDSHDSKIKEGMNIWLSGEGCSLILKPSRVVVGFGESVSVSCEAARPVRVLGWESAISASHTQEDRSVQWKVDSLIDWIEEPICYGVFFTAPKQCEEKLNLVLYKTPDSVSIRQVNHTGPMVAGKEYQLLCEVQNIAPVQYLSLRWYRGQTEVYNHSFSDLTSSSPVQVSSILVITPTKAENGVQYKCVAELELGPEGPQPPPTVSSEPLNASVYCESLNDHIRNTARSLSFLQVFFSGVFVLFCFFTFTFATLAMEVHIYETIFLSSRISSEYAVLGNYHLICQCCFRM